MSVRTATIKTGDIIEANVKGRRFHAVVTDKPSRTGREWAVKVDPITRGISYYNVRGRDLVNHYRKLGR